MEKDVIKEVAAAVSAGVGRSGKCAATVCSTDQEK